MKNIFLESLSNILIKNNFCSNRSVKNFISTHNILINGISVKTKSTLVDIENDIISVDGIIIKNFKHKYFIMNKKNGTVCSTVSDRSPTVFQSLISQSIPFPLQCVGRLDKDTSGLLFLTTNGQFNNFLTSPENNIPKTYKVELQNFVSKQEQIEYIEKCKNKLMLVAEKKSKPCIVENQKLIFINNNECLITITQGKFHQVRRTFLTLGNKVINLKRISIGNIKLPENLKEGEIKEITKDFLITNLF